MSYQVLARKYRPRNFEALVGQEHIVRALTHALEQGRLHHAYLFTGTRGVGKTTLSRILAKSLNCIGSDGKGGITAQPCGECEACTAIDAGRFVDYIEMDAASNRGVDEMAQLLEQAIYAPSNARFKVYMIDEVHMLTNHAFNAMLKTLEEPPDHVKFILATTDPQKIPVTVLSRCLQFNLKQMPPGHIVSHLQNILAQENISFEVPALRLLAQGAQGSMRDALSLTDQAIAYAAGQVTLEAVQGMLGALDHSYLVRVMDALAVGDGATLMSIADEMAERSLSYSVALQDLGSLLHAIALAQTVPAALAEDLPERADVLRLADAFDPETIQLFYQIAVHGRRELGLAPDEYAGFSMTLLRMLAFRPEEGAKGASAGAESSAKSVPRPAAQPAPRAAVASATSASARPATTATPARAALDAARSTGARTQSAPRAEVSQAPKPASRPETPPPPMTDDDGLPPWVTDDAPAASASPPPAQKKTEPKLSASAVEPAAQLSAASPPAAARHPMPQFGWDGDWPSLAAELPVRGVVQQLAVQSELARCEQGDAGVEFRLKIPVDTLRSAGSVDKLASALTERFGVPVRVQADVAEVRDSASLRSQADRAARQREAEQSIESDPFVQAVLREFNGQVVPGSIKPV